MSAMLPHAMPAEIQLLGARATVPVSARWDCQAPSIALQGAFAIGDQIRVGVRGQAKRVALLQDHV
jgi:hypothetical protein